MNNTQNNQPEQNETRECKSAMEECSYPLNLVALAKELKVDCEELEVSRYDDQIIEFKDEEYLVVTDGEADKLWEEDLENYLDDYILTDLPGTVQCYFDGEAWKEHAKTDGRAHSLARYDGKEAIQEIDGITFYIYRQN